ncbi:2-oxoglutarate-dependent dioxygenase [Luteimonas aestuarii]|uniref:2-oxoglutarate-dependent dioxygenase n=1 Tax=Luteimonas aestuarii TaxID=453837 RepID=A0A4R5U4L3_9GAMM|nr:2OG-Fe(II) oxygenase [Luteimonas aestuarii]TDK28676.1 2-oxoglutarate-dependent dioxygenase [Luteimonas aestuarii]
MTQVRITPELERWIVDQAMAGREPDVVVRSMRDAGWSEADAMEAVDRVVRDHLDQNARETGLPPAVRVPAPIVANGASVLDAGDRKVCVLANMLLPRVVLFGGLLSEQECDALIEVARPRMSRSTTVDPGNGGDLVHEARTSRGTFFPRAFDAMFAAIEARIARLLEWPADHGEGLQILHYGPGAEYKPHYDYFDPALPGSEPLLRRGGQRVASLVMYLNTPECGGATTFPDVRFEAAAIKGNAVFFSYDRPHPMTRSLHGGAPVVAGEKWVATKWLRERAHL